MRPWVAVVALWLVLRAVARQSPALPSITLRRSSRTVCVSTTASAAKSSRLPATCVGTGLGVAPEACQGERDSRTRGVIVVSDPKVVPG